MARQTFGRYVGGCWPRMRICQSCSWGISGLLVTMPITGSALFDDMPRGWCVFEPGSAHCPTVTQGQALVLYMLPGGEIEFTGQ